MLSLLIELFRVNGILPGFASRVRLSYPLGVVVIYLYTFRVVGRAISTRFKLGQEQDDVNSSQK